MTLIQGAGASVAAISAECTDARLRRGVHAQGHNHLRING